MLKNWISTINLSVGALAAALLLGAAGLFLSRPTEIALVDDAAFKTKLPKGAFVMGKHAYDAISGPFLSLRFSPHTIQLPDLHKALVFFGFNGRPDAQLEKPLLHFAFSGNKTLSSVSPGEKLYVLYNKELTPAQYVFSPNNAETQLWLEASPQGSDVLVKVAMADENGELIAEPQNYAQFTLQAKEYAKFNGTSGHGELGKWRIDGSLLARQKARWYGLDRFLEQHGGDEFSALKNKQRVDFGEDENVYSVFAAQGDCLIWKDDKWNPVTPGKDSQGYPLLLVKKVDDRLMNLELWDVEGKSKVALNLLKSNEPFVAQTVEDAFRFVGARTRSQFVFEIDEERMLLRPKDWLVMTEDGWKKLMTPEEIDAYVERKVSGPLFIFDGIGRKDDKQVLLGKIYNASRTEMQTVELPLMQGGVNTPSSIEDRREDDENTLENPVAKHSFKTYDD